MTTPYDAPISYDAALPWDGLTEGTMALRRMWDASTPPATPPNWEVCAGYIGGNTPHVWSDAEWDRQRARWRLPIFVRSRNGDPNTDGATAVRWLRAHGVPPGCCVALDFETRVDPDYLRAFDRAITQAGYLTIVYGTRRTVLQNPEPSGGYWDAQWTGVPHLNPGSAATQYGGDTTLGQPYDASLVADSTPLWDTREDILTQEEHDALIWLRQNVVALRDQGVRMTDHGDPTVAGRANHLKQVRADIAALQADVAELKATLAVGIKVSLDVTQLTPDQLELIATVFAGRVVITGVQAKAGQFTVTFEPAA